MRYRRPQNLMCINGLEIASLRHSRCIDGECHHLRSTSMKSSVSSLALAALVMGAAPVAAQGRPTASLTPYVGYLAAGSIANGPFGFEIGNAGAPVYGVQLGINLHKNFAIVGNVGYADSQLEAGLPVLGGLN